VVNPRILRWSLILRNNDYVLEHRSADRMKHADALSRNCGILIIEENSVFLCGEPRKGSKSLKIFKISLTFRFDKLSHLSKSVHTGEISQILTVSNKKHYYESKMNLLCPEVKTILALKFDSR
jgi:hypothetical protein